MYRLTYILITKLLLDLTCTLLARQYPAYDKEVNYWEAYAPGKLLHKLDLLTDAAVAGSPLMQLAADTPNPKGRKSSATTTTTLAPILHRKADSYHDNEDDNNDDDDVEGQSTNGDNDYERTYEQFVQAYFDRPENDDDNDADSSVSAQSGSFETHSIEIDDNAEEVDDIDDDDANADADDVDADPIPKASRQQIKAKREHCKKVRRNRQQCEICKNPRNNEISETCSYSHEDQPQKYAYGSEKQFKRYKDTGDNSDSAEIIEQKLPPSKQRTASSSLCVRRLERHKVCYECKDSAGKQLLRCYDNAPATSKKHKLKKLNKSSNGAEQRIYKRTVSVYAQESTNGTDPATAAIVNDNEEGASGIINRTTTHKTLPLSTNFQRRHSTLVKVVRKKRIF